MLHASPFFQPPLPFRTRLAVHQDPTVAPLHAARLGSATLSACGLLRGCWATLVTECEGEIRQRVVVVELDESVLSMTIAMSPSLAFNLRCNAWVDLQGGGTWVPARSVRIKTDQPPVAKAVTLARVKCPHSSGAESYVAQLKRFFSGKPSRVVHLGDVFEIPSSPVDAGSLDKAIDLYGENSSPAPPPLFFQVTLLDSESDFPDAYVDVATTRLAVAGAVNSRIPPRLLPSPVVVESLSHIVVPAVEAQLSLCVLLSGPKGAGKTRACEALAARLGVHLLRAPLAEARGLPVQRAHDVLEGWFEKARDMSPCILVLRGVASLSPPASQGRDKPDDADLVASAFWKARLDKGVVIVGTCEQPDDVPQLLRGCFTHEIALPAPDLEVRKRLFGNLLANASVHPDVSPDKLAALTAGRTPGELRAVLANAGVTALARHAEQITEEDFERAIDALPSALETSAAAPKIPAVYWDDVGGLKHAKDEILDMVQLPLQKPELFASGVRSRSGILLFGPPGTGKTLLAKAVATECRLNFLSVKGPELLDMYIGESERKVRQVFETARNAKPCVLFFDELDSLAPQRGRGSDSGGVMDRVVSQLLTELDGMQGNVDVFVMGATNRPDLLDQSLLRPGRFDRLLYLGVATEPDEQLKIVRALTRKYAHAADVDLPALVQGLPRHLTGADFYALCSNAMANALKRRVKELKTQAEKMGVTPSKLLASLPEEDLQVTVTMADYNLARFSLVPSVRISYLFKQL